MLSRTQGLITYVLRTRAPLTAPKNSPFDLHVLGPPQTFALSQDQTLQFDAVVRSSQSRSSNRTGLVDLTAYRIPQAHIFRIPAFRRETRAFLVVSSSSTSFQRASRRRSLPRVRRREGLSPTLVSVKSVFELFCGGPFDPVHVCSAVLVGLGGERCSSPGPRDLVVFPGTVKGLVCFS